ncbi:MAG: hypothetical protein KJ747_00930 [Actinobacteria bacterium]|nr:hypothetical protein [Actinomycetota bacterium]MCG2806694.1 hypothetical protein [Coriobacteriia bacterium]
MNQPTSGLFVSAVATTFALAGCTIGLASMMSSAFSGATGEVALIPAVLGVAFSLTIWPLRLGLRAIFGVAVAMAILLALAMTLPIVFLLMPVLAYTSPWWMLIGCGAIALLYSIFAVVMAASTAQPRHKVALLIVSSATLLFAVVVAFAFRDGDIVYTLDVARTRFAMAMDPALALIFGVTSGWLGAAFIGTQRAKPAISAGIEQALRADGQER